MRSNWADNLNWHDIASTLDALPHGQKGAYKDRLCQMIGVTKSTFHREHARRFGKQREISRERSVYTPELCRRAWEIRSLIAPYALLGSDRHVRTEKVIELLRREGAVGPDDLSTSGLNAAWREYGYHDVQPRKRVEASHACHVFRLDFSRSDLFQVVGVDDEGDIILKLDASEKHYKRGGQRFRLWVIQLLDDYSRAAIYRYVATTGESALVGLQFFQWVFTEQPDNGHMLRHPPEILVTHNGSFGKDKRVLNFMQSVGIQLERTAPGNKDSNGKVERGFRSLWEGFEADTFADLRTDKQGTILLSELNRRVYDWSIEQLRRIHPVLKIPRGTAYQQSVLKRRVQQLDVDVMRLAHHVFPRKVDATCWFWIKNVAYRAPSNLAGKPILAYRNAEGEVWAEASDGSDSNQYPCPIAQADTFGEFKHTQPKTIGTAVTDQVIRDDRSERSAPLLPRETRTVESPAELALRPEEKQYRALEAMQMVSNTLELVLGDVQIARQIVSNAQNLFKPWMTLQEIKEVEDYFTSHEQVKVISSSLSGYRRAANQ